MDRRYRTRSCTDPIYKFPLSKKPYEVTTMRTFGKPGIPFTFSTLALLLA
jgi:hypothetical protein